MRSNKVNVLKKMLGMILVAPVMLSLSLFAADPVHHWELDETAGSIYVDSSGDANGTCTSPDGCPAPSDGQIYGAQSFDGNDTIEVTNTANFDWTADANITIEFWMKSDVNSSIAEHDMMIGRQGVLGTLDFWYVATETGTGKIRAAVGSNDGTVYDGFTGATTITNGEWNHIAYIVTSDRIMVYVNGVIDINETRTNTGGSLHVDSGDVTIGSLNRSGNWGYTGLLDDVKLYTTDLNGSTIKEHYENGFKPHLVEVIPVPTPTTDTTPDYTFSSDMNGTIEIGGSCSDATERNATVGNNTITFSELLIDTYTDCSVTVTSTDGNISDPLEVTTFEVTAEPDVTAPTLAEVTAVVSPTDDNTPDYTFSSDEAGTIQIGGSCSDAIERNATVGNNTITFDTLADKVYGDCTITVTDAADNASDPLLVSEFVVDTTVPDTTVTTTSDGGGCTYNPDSKNFDMMFLLMMALGLFYPLRRRYIK